MQGDDVAEHRHGGMAQVDERDAIARLKQGDMRGLEALMQAYQVRAIRAAYLVTHDLPLAEDIVQSAFIRAYERIAQFDDSRPFGPWFLRGVVNSATTAAGRQRRQVPLTGVNDDAPWEPLDSDPGPEQFVLAAETASEVWQALESLPAEQRAALVLRYYLELPEVETAARLGTPPGTVKSRLSAARSKLRTTLGPGAAMATSPDEERRVCK